MMNIKSPSLHVLGWGFFILVGSILQPGSSPQGIFLKIPHLDKLIHFVFYFVLCWLLIRAKRGKFQQGTNLIRVYCNSFLVAVGYGFCIEIIQYFISWRSFDWLDVLANSLGAITAAILLRWVFS